MYRNIGSIWKQIQDRHDHSGIFINADGSAETDTSGSGGGSGSDPGTTTDSPKLFTQADMDRQVAEARRKGAEAATARTAANQAKFKEELLSDFEKRFSLTPQAVTKATDPVKPAAQTQIPDPAPIVVKPPAQTQTPAGDHDQDSKAQLAEVRAVAERTRLDLEKERGARLKLEAGLLEEKKSTEAAKAESRKNSAMEDLVGTLVSEGKLPDKVARGVAKVMMADDRILIVVDAKGGAKSYWKTGEVDDEGNAKTLPLKDGITAWAKTDEADQYRPAIVPGAGTRGSNANPFGVRRDIDPKNMSEVERWQNAEDRDSAQRQVNRRR